MLRWTLFERDLSARSCPTISPAFPTSMTSRPWTGPPLTPPATRTSRPPCAFWWIAPHSEAAALVLTRPREARQDRPMSADWISRMAQRHPEAADILAR